jgi:predicted nucleic acid-binding protein
LSKPFVDSNVILYLLSGDTVKADRAQDIVAAGAVISEQVLTDQLAESQAKATGMVTLDAVLAKNAKRHNLRPVGV